MLSPDEQNELRALELRVYAPGGEDNHADRVRLAELEQRRSEAASGAETRVREPAETGKTVTPDAAPRAVVDHVLERVPTWVETDEVRAAGEAGLGGDEPPWSERLRTWRPRMILGAALALVLVGVGLGAALPKPAGTHRLTASQAASRDVLVEEIEKIDVRSIRLLDTAEWTRSGTSGGTVSETGREPVDSVVEVFLWALTQSEGSWRCLVIEAAGQIARDCQPTDSEWSGNFSVQLEPENMGADGDIAMTTQVLVTGAAISSDDGEMIGRAVVWDDVTVSYRTESDYRTDAENSEAARLMEEWGLAFDPSLVGYVDDLPVWSGAREETNEQCLMLIDDGTVHADCTSLSEQPWITPERDGNMAGVVLSISLAERPGRSAALIEQRLSMFSRDWLTITREGSPSSAWLIPAAD